MTTHYADHDADTGLALTVELFSEGSDAVAYTASVTAAQSNRIGTYRSTFINVAAGLYELRSRVGSTPKASWCVRFAGTDNEVVTGRLSRETVSELAAAALTAIAAAVWSYTTRTLTDISAALLALFITRDTTKTSGDVHAGSVAGLSGGGGTGETVVNVTVPRSVATSSTDPDTITAVRAATIRRSLPAVGSLVGIEELWLTVKRSLDDLDADALLQTKLTVGLVRVNGAAATPTDSSLEITDYSEGNVDWYVKASAMSQLPLIQGAHFDLKGRFTSSGDVVVLIDDGTFNLTSEVTDAT